MNILQSHCLNYLKIPRHAAQLIRFCSGKVANHYDVLGIPRNASKKQIRAAFVLLSKQHHPDARPDLGSKSEEFNRIAEAYNVLGNSDKKLEYDYELMRKENPSVPPTDDVMAQFYKDGTIYTGKDKRLETGYTNGQVVAAIVIFSTLVGIAQILRARWAAIKRAERDSAEYDETMAQMETLRARAASKRSKLYAEIAHRKLANEKQLVAETEEIIDRAPGS